MRANLIYKYTKNVRLQGWPLHVVHHYIGCHSKGRRNHIELQNKQVVNSCRQAQNIYVHVTVHRNKFLYNKTN
jgi:hypothetical protein